MTLPEDAGIPLHTALETCLNKTSEWEQYIKLVGVYWDAPPITPHHLRSAETHNIIQRIYCEPKLTERCRLEIMKTILMELG